MLNARARILKAERKIRTGTFCRSVLLLKSCSMPSGEIVRSEGVVLRGQSRESGGWSPHCGPGHGYDLSNILIMQVSVSLSHLLNRCTANLRSKCKIPPTDLAFSTKKKRIFKNKTYTKNPLKYNHIYLSMCGNRKGIGLICKALKNHIDANTIILK